VTAKRRVQLTLSQGKKNKDEDEVDDEDDDDDMVRTSVSQNRVTATLCRGIVPFHSVYNNIALPTDQRGNNLGVGEDMDSQHDTFDAPAGSHTSQLDLIMGFRASDKTGYLYYYFVTGEDDEAVFPISAIQYLCNCVCVCSDPSEGGAGWQCKGGGTGRQQAIQSSYGRHE
jgi:hypothetical protein